MARPSSLIEDPTALDGARIDVASRIGWLLRMARLGRGVSLGRMSQALGEAGHPVSVPALSVAERQGARDGVLTDLYERALDLPDGHLRAPVDVLCRTFDYAPSDRAPALAPPVRLSAVDEAYAPVLAGTATGGQWLRWARLLRLGAGAATPTVVVEPLLRRLLEELVRAVGPGFTCRYEAVAQLRCGPYADLVDDLGRALVLGPGPGPATVNVLSALAEEPSRRLLAWCAELLEHDRAWVVSGACTALEGMRTVGGLRDDDWGVVAAPLVRALDRHAAGPLGAQVTAVVRVLPATVRRAVLEAATATPAPVRGPRSWDPGLANRQLGWCTRLAADACDRLEVEHQPLLARMLFEVLYDVRGTRVITSAWMLMSTPFSPGLVPDLLALVDDPPDETTARGALRAVHHLQVPASSGVVADWLGRTGRWDDPAVLGVAGNAGVAAPDGHARVRAAGAAGINAVESLGMAAHDDLVPVAADETLDPATRAAARWWREVGGRVTD